MKFLSLLLFPLLSCAAYAQNTLTIHGYAPKLKDGTLIYFEPFYPRRFSNQQEKETAEIRKYGSFVVKNGKFQSKMKIRNGEIFILSLDRGKSEWLCLSPGKVAITIPDTSLLKIEIDSNKTALEYKMYNGSRSKIYRDFALAKRNWYNSMETKDIPLINKKKQLYDSLKVVVVEQDITDCRKWIFEHPDSFINASLLYNSQKSMADAEVKKIFLSFPKSVKNNRYGDDLQYIVDSLLIGGYAPKFVQNDTSGRLVSLKSFKGKYVFIDFWASWCVPCRAENPNVVKAMNKYSGKNFTTISISLDSKKDAWINAIKQDGLNWTHLSDLKEFQNEVSVKYNIYSIPDNFLIDPDGRIIASHLHGEQLLKLLDQLVK
ncbi:TlpA disulfide reductase family protein [Pedobacter nutrimenti]|uniref:TlpA family protein disulfide reductase n=1 Tax=Pedobacter nutrimenti TaxID=1241337 RepID=UPI00292CFA7A|nr:TlpA disulfide reductase family protein [Pedobacter nutrimenti]